MLRKFIAAGFVAAVVVSLVAAEEFAASITKVDSGKVTFAKLKKGEKGKLFERDVEQTLPVADKVKVSRGRFDFKEKKYEVTEELTDGLQNERFKKIGEKGMFARIVTNDDGKITEIRITEFKKKDN
jgi:hypothetical protein